MLQLLGELIESEFDTQKIICYNSVVVPKKEALSEKNMEMRYRCFCIPDAGCGYCVWRDQ